MDRAEYFGWTLWNQKTGTPGKSSKNHLTIDGKTALCGVKVPEHVADMGAGCGFGSCRRCVAVERKLAARETR